MIHLRSQRLRVGDGHGHVQKHCKEAKKSVTAKPARNDPHHNRAGDIRRALQKIKKQVVPPAKNIDMQIHKLRKHGTAHLPDGVGGIMRHRTVLRPISYSRQMIRHGIPVVRRGNQGQAEHCHTDQQKNAVIRRATKRLPHTQPRRPRTLHHEPRRQSRLLKLRRQQKQKQRIKRAPSCKEESKAQGMSCRQCLREHKKKKHPQTTGLHISAETCVLHALSLFIHMNIAIQRYHRKQHICFLSQTRRPGMSHSPTYIKRCIPRLLQS